jgi:hypothetical protein
VDITNDLDPDTDEISCVDTYNFFSEAMPSSWGFNLGEDVFMIGAFLNDKNINKANRNFPVARFGNVARLAGDEVCIGQEDLPPRPTHLVDMRSRSGYSGSPVFIYRLRTEAEQAESALNLIDHRQGLFTALHAPDDPPGAHGYRPEHYLFLLGIHCAQYPEEAKGPDREIYKIPGAMNMVVPATRIAELLAHPALKKQRDEREGRPERIKLASKIPDLESAKGEEAPSDSNPAHREAFRSLLDAAAKKKQRDG